MNTKQKNTFYIVPVQLAPIIPSLHVLQMIVAAFEPAHHLKPSERRRISTSSNPRTWWLDRQA
jgi:hypothetical protein